MGAEAAKKALETGQHERGIGSVSRGGAHADGEAGGVTRNEVDEIAGALSRTPPAVVIQALDARALLRGFLRNRGFRRIESERAARTGRSQYGAHSKGWVGPSERRRACMNESESITVHTGIDETERDIDEAMIGLARKEALRRAFLARMSEVWA